MAFAIFVPVINMIHKSKRRYGKFSRDRARSRMMLPFWRAQRYRKRWRRERSSFWFDDDDAGATPAASYEGW